MTNSKISAVITTWNEAANLDECLATLDFVNEIVIVDMESTDNTVKIAKTYTDKVYRTPYTGYVEPARNFSIGKASGSWILVVDGDERIPVTLAKKLVEIAENNSADFVRIPRKNLVFSQWLKYSRWWPDYNIRFFKKGYVTWQDAIHSIPVTEGVGINLDPEPEFAIIHHHYRTIDEYIIRMLRYTSQQSKELIEAGYQFSLADLINKPAGEFLSRFFAGEGYKDGLHGLALAILQSFSMFVVYFKVWQEEGFVPQKDVLSNPSFKKLIKEKFTELKYWLYTIKIHLTGKKSEKFLLKIKRKFNL
ncbi:MAG: Glycosyl transferase family 2 [Candidatus Nomurabacteria bacterium GW2011_GWC2_41_8]|uniref:Glycosyl transferase family 2 n=1 Tax=Candidatus Nomurabacteria bacterium GW2011_GWC2_41_8 TaxID=1618755 RepID=A0A0G0ZMY7_9BACT|nr:MAG: Glycosyl transferase family 2 [Candidatus Nomurabacteria bacterium GW2011_GWC2_41_8]